MSAHTPGPWTTVSAKQGPDRDIGIAAPRCAGVIAECFEEFRAPRVHSRDECAANALLIAAAPELLAALREYHKANRLHHDEDARLYELSSAAIAKAEPDSQEAKDRAEVLAEAQPPTQDGSVS